MAVGIGSKRIDQHVGIRKGQRSRPAAPRSSSSCNAAESSRSIPGIRPPFAELTGGRARFLRAAGPASSRTLRKPSSIRAVNERPPQAPCSWRDGQDLPATGRSFARPYVTTYRTRRLYVSLAAPDRDPGSNHPQSRGRSTGVRRRRRRPRRRAARRSVADGWSRPDAG